MAPQPTYDPPHVQLGRLMVEARRQGMDFEAWWAAAVRPGKALVMVTHPQPPDGAVQWPTDRNDRVTWQHAIVDSKEGWRRAFEQEQPTPQEAALAFLAPGLEALGEVAEERAHDELTPRRAGISAQRAVASAA